MFITRTKNIPIYWHTCKREIHLHTFAKLTSVWISSPLHSDLLLKLLWLIYGGGGAVVTVYRSAHNQVTWVKFPNPTLCRSGWRYLLNTFVNYTWGKKKKNVTVSSLIKKGKKTSCLSFFFFASQCISAHNPQSSGYIWLSLSHSFSGFITIWTNLSRAPAYLLAESPAGMNFDEFPGIYSCGQSQGRFNRIRGQSRWHSSTSWGTVGARDAAKSP